MTRHFITVFDARLCQNQPPILILMVKQDFRHKLMISEFLGSKCSQMHHLLPPFSHSYFCYRDYIVQFLRNPIYPCRHNLVCSHCIIIILIIIRYVSSCVAFIYIKKICVTGVKVCAASVLVTNSESL